MNTIHQQWTDYCKRSYPEGMPEHQRRELYHCWFAAMLAMLVRVKTLRDAAALDDGDTKYNSEIEKIFHEVLNECEYIRAVGEQQFKQN